MSACARKVSINIRMTEAERAAIEELVIKYNAGASSNRADVRVAGTDQCPPLVGVGPVARAPVMIHYSRRTGAAVAVLPPEQGRRHLVALPADPYRVDLLPSALCAGETEVISP